MSNSRNESGNIQAQPTKRLQRLRVGVKLMLMIGLLVCVYVVFSAFRSGDNNEVSTQELQVDVTAIVAGQSLLVDWGGRPVLIVHRTDAQIQSLASSKLKLTDPDSSRSGQPQFALNPLRSSDRQWFVAIAMGTDFSCIVSLQSVPVKVAGLAGLTGLRDSCRGSYYDLSGRVFSDQYAERNLTVPNYRLHAGSLLLGGS